VTKLRPVNQKFKKKTKLRPVDRPPDALPLVTGDNAMTMRTTEDCVLNIGTKPVVTFAKK